MRKICSALLAFLLCSFLLQGDLTPSVQEEEAEEDEQDPMKDFEVPQNARTMHEKELEAEVVARRRGQEARLPELVHQLNALIHDPLNKLPVEPSHFQAPVLQWLVRDASG